MLAPGGRACIQTILIPDARYRRYRSSPDWIERYVFPGLPHPLARAPWRRLRASSNPLPEEIGQHYGETLARWREAFVSRLGEVRALGYDERFVRTWDFYLASCEALFRAGLLRDAQLVVTR